MKILVTGGAGFIGSNFIHYILDNYNWDIVNLDKLTYAGNLDNLHDVTDNPRYQFVRGDINNRGLVEELMDDGIDSIINFAAESHVDNSIEKPGVFLETNVRGTQVLLDIARRAGIEKFIQVSTDEVYGSLAEKGYFSEDSRLSPSSPYAASKASADLIALSYHRTYGLPVIITRCSNNYGPYQFPEKLIPLFVTNALDNKKLPLYGDGENIRDWLHVKDHCRALTGVLLKGVAGEIYNIGANNERTNREITDIILDILDKPQSLIEMVPDRPGHDYRYALACQKLKTEFKWQPEYAFREGIEETINWYRKNEWWWRKTKEGRE